MNSNQAVSKKANMQSDNYAARLKVDYPGELDRGSTLLRLIFIIPIAIILSLVSGSGETVINTIYLNDAQEVIRRTSETTGELAASLPVAVALMILVRQRYPRWWFDFLRELTRFGARVCSYAFLLTDKYPSTVDTQAVHLEIDYPEVETDLQRWMPLVKWFLAIPHYIVLAILSVASVFAAIFAWFAIMVTGKYPKDLFDFNVGVMRWWLRVNAYAFLLVTDEYPPFSLR